MRVFRGVWVHCFSIKRIFPEYWPTRPYYNLHTVRSLKFVSLSRGVPLNGRGVGGGVGWGVGSELRLTTWRPPRLVPRFLDKSIFSWTLTPRARYPKDASTIPTRSCHWTLPGSPVAYRYWGGWSLLRLAKWRPPRLVIQLSLYSKFSPNTDPQDASTITLLGSPVTNRL